jgi:hypothetical protein
MSKEKSFDAVAFMRKRREEIDKEDAALSWAEKREKTRRMIEDDPLYRRLKDRVVRPNGPRNMAANEQHKPDYGRSTD